MKKKSAFYPLEKIECKSKINPHIIEICKNNFIPSDDFIPTFKIVYLLLPFWDKRLSRLNGREIEVCLSNLGFQYGYIIIENRRFDGFLISVL